MDYEQKYKEALERARIWKDKGGMPKYKQGILDDIFPELAESEDERIRKAIHIYLDWLDGRKDYAPRGEYTIRDMIAWLEKQGKQNPCESCEEPRLNCQNFPCERKKNFDSANKVKPKFKVGDWIIGRATNNEPRQISEITDQYYKSTYGGQYGFSFENEMHLWTIQDAKDGDVLACENGWTCIFKTLVNNETFSSYCFMDNTKWFCETGSECHTLKEEFVKAYNGKIHPATKEQCEQLKKAMVDAGYMWDEEKKELKKIEQKPADWSEEDETRLTNIIIMLKEGASHHFIKDDITKAVDWLKSLRPQNHWKPTEEQVEAFEHFVRSIGESGYASPYENNTKLLYSLLNDLEKLIE